MCGIAGIIERNNRNKVLEVQKMLSVSHHRGPDASDIFHEKNVKSVKSTKDLIYHDFVSYVYELIEFPELNYLKEINKNLNVVFASNSLRSQLLAVKNGVGLGLLHSFIAQNECNLVPILPDAINIKREYWIVVHENLSNLQRIKAVTNFLTFILKNEKKNFDSSL